jgi:hypothetical protein
MPATETFAGTFETLKALLQQEAKRQLVTVDKPGDFQVSSPTLTDRTGRPLFIACVAIKKTYVSFHLMPLYMNPTLLALVPAGLKKRMQGKACFNFTTIDAAQVKELSALTRSGIESYKHLTLPWTSKPSAAKALKATASTAKRTAAPRTNRARQGS